MNVSEIRPDQMVHAKGAMSGTENMMDSEGVHVGTVDHLDGERFIKLKRNDSVDGKHHWIPIDWVERVEDQTVFLNKDEEEFRRDLINESPMH